MPVAGDEGYEKLVICPYDRSHEIRMGRMQFHLDKCRKNYPATELTECPFNTAHLIPKLEVEYHTEEDCANRSNWDRHTHEVGDTNCPVKDLVPVNAATVPDGDENWDTFETQGSVLSLIKTQAQDKEIFRMMQCESKAKRKNFRKAERARMSQLIDNGPLQTAPEEPSTSTPIAGPLRRPTTQPTIQIVRQDPEAAAAISQQFRTLDLNMKSPKNNSDASDTSSMYNGPPSVTPTESTLFESASTSAAPRISYAQVSTKGRSSGTSAFSSRPSTAMSIAASVRPPSTMSNYTEMASSEENFCQIPIPGLGRGSRGRGKKK